MIYFIKRLLWAIPLFIGITLVSFLIMKVSPGDPALIFKDPRLSMVDIEQLRVNLGLNQPIYVQYWKWLIRFLQGDLGFSYTTGERVLTMLLDRLPATLILSISSLFVILLITLPLGLWSGYKQDSPFDHSVTFFSFLGLSIPSFWLGLLFILLFSYWLKLFPSSGYMDPLYAYSGAFSRFLNICYHLCLPLVTIVVGGIAGLTRYYRFGILTILHQDYITAARSRGLSEQRILFKHALKNACLPIITILGLQLPGLISGSFIIEFIFSWPGLGQLGLHAIFARDYPVIMATIVFSSILIILGNLLADMAYAALDPRIRRP